MSALTDCPCGHDIELHDDLGCIECCSHFESPCRKRPRQVLAAREAAAREAVLAEVEALAREFIPPYNCELRYDGAEDPSIAAWVEDRSEVVDRLHALVARLRADA